MDITAVFEAAAEALKNHNVGYDDTSKSTLCSCGALCTDFEGAQQHRVRHVLIAVEPVARELVAGYAVQDLDNQRLTDEVDRISRTFPAAGFTVSSDPGEHIMTLEDMCACGALAGDSHLALGVARTAVTHVARQVARAVNGHSNYLVDTGDTEGAEQLTRAIDALGFTELTVTR